ncbi:hypothetical protein ACFLSJ_00540 [Verrucomicrobiota bacterium]
MKSCLKSGCLVVAGLIVVTLVLTVIHVRREYPYSDSMYRRDYIWSDVEVGTIFRLPIGPVIPIGRRHAVIAFPTGRDEEARVLHSFASCELPPTPTVLSSNGPTIVYRELRGSFPVTNDVTIDISAWKSFPLRSETSPRPIHRFNASREKRK